jgi:hypothetical protein
MPIREYINKQLLALTGNRVAKKDLGFYVDMLRRGEPFSFARFGDGEWNAILGVQGANCDGHEYFPELGVDLRAALIDKKDYFYSIQGRAIKYLGKGIRRFVKKNNVKIEWHDSDIFHQCDNAGTLFPLVEQLRTMKTVVIGPAHLRVLDKSVFAYAHFIEIPPKNCYLDKDKICGLIADYYRGKGPAVFCFSASMTANVLIHELFSLMGHDSWLIDFGSLWDCYVGVDSRGGKSRKYWDVLIHQNTGNSGQPR